MELQSKDVAGSSQPRHTKEEDKAFELLEALKEQNTPMPEKGTKEYE